MLKIKDNVDLKELERFGFELQEDWWTRPKEITKNNITGYEIYYKHVAPYTSIEIELETRIITQNYEDVFVKVSEDYIHDLIKADLVEEMEK